MGAIRTGWQLYQSTKEDSLLHQLFQFAEKSKAGIIREALGEMQAKQNAGIPDSLLSLEKNFRVDLAYYDAKIQQFRLQQKEYDSTKVKVFENKFFALNRQYEALIEGFEKNFPKYYQLKYDSRVATVNSIQQALPDQKSILLEYFEGDDSIYIFKITKENIAINAIPKPVDFQQWINDLQKGIGDFSFLQDSVIESYNLYTRSAYKLYELLLKEVLPTNNSEPTQLIIVPDGRLGYIPFETLLYDKVPENLVVNKINYQSLPYLLNRYRINYSYSGSLLLENMHKRSSKADKECLAFAPIYNQGESTIAMRGSLLSLRDTTMTALPGARQEVQALSRFVDGDFRFGSEADERLFKQEASQFQILHLAMHGLTDNQNPSNSRLIFNTVRDSVEDNALYAYELYNMNLNADLVVLSACQTGSGQYAQGEGVMSLARAFMYAGSPSVIQTLWNTEDRASARLMTYFYETLVRGLDKTSALREAKLKYLASANGFEGHPFYWAGFTLYGDVEPISFGNSTTTPLLIILLISFVSIGWFIFKQTKTSLSN